MKNIITICAMSMLTVSSLIQASPASARDKRIISIESCQNMVGAPLGAGPEIVVTRTTGEQVLIPSDMVVYGPLFVTTGATVVSFRTWLPNDLATRRDDLIARVYAERNSGKLTDTQTSNLLAEIRTVASHFVPGDECDASHAKLVNHMYKDFDLVSNDIYDDSRQGDKQLAGKYSYLSSR